MFSKDEIDALKARLVRGDIKDAADIYQQMTGKYLAPTYITMFLKGDRPILGKGQHQPQDIMKALMFVVTLREERTKNTRKVLENILRMQSEAIRESMVI